MKKLLAALLITTSLCGCMSLKNKSVRVDGGAGGLDPNHGAWFAWGTYDSAPNDTTSIRYAYKRTTSIFNSASQDTHETFFLSMPSTNALAMQLDALVTALRAATASTSSTTSTNSIAR